MNASRNIVLACRHVSHWFGTKKVLQDVNLEITEGEIVALVGPSGCGKSTLLRAILGTHPPRAGEVLMNGKAYRNPSRERGIVYQRYALFPFLTAADNVGFGPLLDQTSPAFRLLRPFKTHQLRSAFRQQGADWLAKLRLGAAAPLYPAELSGGMQQRVAIAQALIMKPQILLLDEPFGALDEATREELQMMLLQLYHENQKALAAGERPPYTILMVTHELNEAIYVSSRVLGLSQFHGGGKDGATIVYDQAAPVFQPGDPRSYESFEQQKKILRRAVFDPEHLQHHEEYVKFWSEHDK